MALNLAHALRMVKVRLNRLADDHTLDEYLLLRLAAKEQETRGAGIRLDMNDPRHLMYLVDETVFDYQSRDKPGSRPEWLRLARRELWLQQNEEAT